MKKTVIAIFVLTAPASVESVASQEEFLGWTSAAIQCGRTPEAGDISCQIKTGEKGWESFTVRAFGKKHDLRATDLAKLKGFPLSSLRTTHEPGYQELGGHTVHFRFHRTFYNADKKLVTETIYVSVNKKGLTVSDPRTKEH